MTIPKDAAEVWRLIERGRAIGLGEIEAVEAAVGPLFCEIARLRDVNKRNRYRPEPGDLSRAQRRALRLAAEADRLLAEGKRLESLARLAEAHKKALDALERRGYLSTLKWPAPQVTPAGRVVLDLMNKGKV